MIKIIKIVAIMFIFSNYALARESSIVKKITDAIEEYDKNNYYECKKWIEKNCRYLNKSCDVPRLMCNPRSINRFLKNNASNYEAAEFRKQYISNYYYTYEDSKVLISKIPPLELSGIIDIEKNKIIEPQPELWLYFFKKYRLKEEAKPIYVEKKPVVNPHDTDVGLPGEPRPRPYPVASLIPTTQPNVPPIATIQDINLAYSIMLVVDCSGSMSASDPMNERVNIVLEIIETISTIKQPVFSLGMLCFDDGIIKGSIQPPLYLFFKKDELSKIIEKTNKITASGHTNISLALIEASDMLFKEVVVNGVQITDRYIFLFTDGEHNSGSIPVLDTIADLNKKNIHVCSIGLGSSVNEKTLTELSEKTGCIYMNRANIPFNNFFSYMLEEKIGKKIPIKLMSEDETNGK